jgi:predicted transcriptional regulator
MGGGNVFSKRRSEIDIVKDILEVSRDGAKKTEILYKSNLSFSQLNNYLYLLIEKDIIREDIVSNDSGFTNKVYITTEKGNELLFDINKLLTYFE